MFLADPLALVTALRAGLVAPGWRAVVSDHPAGAAVVRRLAGRLPAAARARWGAAEVVTTRGDRAAVHVLVARATSLPVADVRKAARRLRPGLAGTWPAGVRQVVLTNNPGALGRLLDAVAAGRFRPAGGPAAN